MRRGVLLSCFAFLIFLLLTTVAGAATFDVTTYADIADPAPDGVCESCSLREAILEANFTPGPDVINLPPGLYNLTINGADEDLGQTGDLDITDDVTIIGYGTTWIESQIGRIFHVHSGNVSIIGLSMLQGDAGNEQGSGRAGGAVNNAGSSTLTLNYCTMVTNAAQGGGGGVFNGGTLTLNSSTFIDNTAPGTSRGGAIYNSGTMTVTNCTFYNNSSTDGGGAVYTAAGSTLTINNSTITENSSTGGMGGGGLNAAPASTVNLSNTIFSGNTASGPDEDCEGAITSLGDNIVVVPTGCSGLTIDDITGTDPMLGPLQDNGGRTQTRQLLTGSPAIDAGGLYACELLDQRGLVRPQGLACDIGAFELFPDCPAITFDPLTLPDATTGTFYTQTITPAGGVAPYRFAAIDNNLPDGLYLDPLTGILAGVPTTAGVFNFTVTTFDANLCPGTQLYTLNIVDGGATCSGGVDIVMTPTVLPSATPGQAYSQALTATGGTEPYQFAVTDGYLPPGLTLDPATGAISGSPAVSGTFVFVVTATDANNCTGIQGYTLFVECALTISPATLPGGMASVFYTQTLVGSGGTAPYTFAVVSGGLPPGLGLSGPGVLSGIPTTPGIYTFIVEVTEANFCTGTLGFIIEIIPCITVSPETLPAATLNLDYNATITATGGSGAITFSVTSGSLPAGLTLDPGGAITGIPTAAGISQFTVTATDGTCSTDQIYFIVVNDAACPVITIDPPTLPGAFIGDNYNQNVTASGGNGPYNYELVSGLLPPDLTFDVNGGISGTANAAGSFNFIVGATDSNGCSATQAYNIIITPASCPAFSFFPTTLPDASVNVLYNQTIIATQGVPPYTYTVTGGALPAGMTLDPASGLLTGTPTTEGTYNFTVTATDVTLCTGSIDYTLVVGTGGGGGGTCAVFGDDFEDGVLPNWNFIKPAWSETGGNLVGTPTGRKAIAVATTVFSGCLNCQIEATMQTQGGLYNKVWMLGWYTDKRNTMELMMAEEKGKWILKQRVNGSVVAKGKGMKPIDPNVFYTVRVAFDGTNFNVYVDDLVTPLFTLKPVGTVPTGSLGFQVKNTTGSFGYVCVD